MITPHGNKTGYTGTVLSSATSSTVSSQSSGTAPSSAASIKHSEVRQIDVSDEDENDSPTKGPSTSRAMQKMQLNEKANPAPPVKTINTRSQPTAARPQRPPGKPVTLGGRTSAKFAKVADDPGVEGVPPGPRSMDRPGPSFACIIGQAILKCSAGGLSLEHIYRYVETAYPFFKTGDGAWRNSVRHNLSIHKMFETIPRTEMFPPGKGGIWVIHEDEKCHWPEENKFIKNFPSSHPHHAVCRQTLHERAKEKEAMEKAVREGRQYVPKKGKKGRKLVTKDGEDEAFEMGRTSSELGMEFQPMLQYDNAVYQAGPSSAPNMMAQALQQHTNDGTLPDFEDDGEFLPVEDMEPETSIEIESPPEPVMQPPPQPRGQMPPPRFELPKKEKRRLLEDEENVFTTGVKRVRVTEPGVLAPILPHTQDNMIDLDDTFITPERERPISATNAKIMSSAFKTPALVNTSSSPGSSPMPPTIPRTTHNPSALQQAWTHDDMEEAATSSSSPQRPMLESAFDFQPKMIKHRTRTLVGEDEFPINTTNPPKTPLTRSSAARDLNKTPGNGMHSKTPLTFGRSPAQAPPTISALLSTPMWEMGGCLDRLKDYGSSPTQRSPVPPTSPTRYVLLGSPTARKLREFTL